MPSSPFPHLVWTSAGTFRPKFQPNRNTPDEIKKAKANPIGHSAGLGSQLASLRAHDIEEGANRSFDGMPEIRGKGFILRVPPGSDVDSIAHTLDVELVAETESGLMFAASHNLDLAKLESVLQKFSLGVEGGGAAASIVEIFDSKEDPRKLEEILNGPVLELWPFDSRTIYTFDLSIQTAPSTKSFAWTRKPTRRKGETDGEYKERVAKVRADDWARADEEWLEAAQERVDQLAELIEFHRGTITRGYTYDPSRETIAAILFPDSVEMRVRMTGEGFADVVRNFPFLFQVSLPPSVAPLGETQESMAEEPSITLIAPLEDDPVVCVIDSGIQEDHRLLAPAVDNESSRCFIPELSEHDTADFVQPRGHGTRVAGAVLFPRGIPLTGEVEAIAWIQNARVLDHKNFIPISLPPANYIESIVRHFSRLEKQPKIYNHSISSELACEGDRMCAWGAKIDEVSHQYDVLIVQAAGNVPDQQILRDFDDGKTHPLHLLTAEAKVANPGQSLHALTVGSISHHSLQEAVRKSTCDTANFPSPFSRSGHSPLWGVVKPEVVEYGGDLIVEIPPGGNLAQHHATSPELVASTLYGAPAVSADDVGTSFAAPKVAHIAAAIQKLFPDSSPQLYRALIAQSARWPAEVTSTLSPELALKLVGYGTPSLELATTNSTTRVTLVTKDAVEIGGREFHLYSVRIPPQVRRAASEAKIRVDVCLSYTSSPRRTRARRIGYLETWLDWRSINKDEPLSAFQKRIEGERTRSYPGYKWVVSHRGDLGQALDGNRDRGSLQKDWMYVQENELPEEFAIAVRGHCGWNHRDGAGIARYCLTVSFEAQDMELPLYTHIRGEVEVENEVEIATGAG